MNELLQKHGCSNVFHYPDGLQELMADISREVLREQPVRIYEFIANYLSVLLITREHGILTVKILEDLCDCRPSVSEHLLQLGMSKEEAETAATVIKEEIENVQIVEGKEKLKEADVLKKLLKRLPLDEEMTTHVCEVARNAYKDFWYRKQLLEQNLKEMPEQTWEIAAQRTLEIYKKTKPSFSELTRATQRIQAAYKGYYIRKKMLKHVKPKKHQTPKVDLQGPPVDIAESRNADLGRILDIEVKTDNVDLLFTDEDSKRLGLFYDTTKTITHVNKEKPDESIKVESKISSIIERESKINRINIGGGSTVAASTKYFHDDDVDIDDTSSRKGISFDLSNQKVEVLESQILEVPEEVSENVTEVLIEPSAEYHGEDESESVPLSSVLSSAPTSAPSTDIEEMGEISSAEEEG